MTVMTQAPSYQYLNGVFYLKHPVHESIASKKRNLAIKRGVTPLLGGLVTRFGRPTAFFRAGLDRYYSAGKTEALGQAPQNGRRPTFAIDS